MDDVYGVADISKKCANFLTVSRKFGYYCVYFFTLLLLLHNRLWQEQERDKETLMSTLTEEIESQLDQNFSQEDNDIPNNDVPKKKKENSKIKL